MKRTLKLTTSVGPLVIFPGHALHEKDLQRKSNVGPLVSSQERRAAERPSSRGQAGHKPLVNRALCSSIGLHRNSLVRASEVMSRTIVFDALEALESKRDGYSLGEPTRGVPPCPAPLRAAAPPCAAPPRPARGISGVWTRRVEIKYKRRSTGHHQPGTMSGFQVMNRISFPTFGLHIISFVRVSEETSRVFNASALKIKVFIS